MVQHTVNLNKTQSGRIGKQPQATHAQDRKAAAATAVAAHDAARKVIWKHPERITRGAAPCSPSELALKAPDDTKLEAADALMELGILSYRKHMQQALAGRHSVLRQSQADIASLQDTLQYVKLTPQHTQSWWNLNLLEPKFVAHKCAGLHFSHDAFVQMEKKVKASHGPGRWHELTDKMADPEAGFQAGFQAIVHSIGLEVLSVFPLEDTFPASVPSLRGIGAVRYSKATKAYYLRYHPFCAVQHTQLETSFTWPAHFGEPPSHPLQEPPFLICFKYSPNHSCTADYFKPTLPQHVADHLLGEMGFDHVLASVEAH